MNCAACGRRLCQDEIGLSCKLISRGTTVFYCVPCLAGRFRTTEQALLELADRFRESGCTLFPPKI